MVLKAPVVIQAAELAERKKNLLLLIKTASSDLLSPWYLPSLPRRSHALREVFSFLLSTLIGECPILFLILQGLWHHSQIC